MVIKEVLFVASHLRVCNLDFVGEASKEPGSSAPMSPQRFSFWLAVSQHSDWMVTGLSKPVVVMRQMPPCRSGKASTDISTRPCPQLWSVST